MYMWTLQSEVVRIETVRADGGWAALLVERYVSNAASFVLCAFGRVKEHHMSLHYLPRLKN